MFRTRLGLVLAALMVTTACTDQAPDEVEGELTEDSTAVSQSPDADDTSGVDGVAGRSSGRAGASATGGSSGRPSTDTEQAAGATAQNPAMGGAGQSGAAAEAADDDAGVMDMMPPTSGSGAPMNMDKDMEKDMGTDETPQAGSPAMPAAGTGGGSAGTGGTGGGAGEAAAGQGGEGGTMSGPATGEPELNAACLTLQQCCEGRQGPSRMTCERTVEAGDFGACRGALAQFCAPEQPMRQRPAECTMLGTCCATLEGDERRDCDVVVSAADARVCEAAAANFCKADSEPMNPECAALKQCCDTLEDNAAKRDCERVQMASDSVVCQAATIAYCPNNEPQMPGEPGQACAALASCCEEEENLGNRVVCQGFAASGDPMVCEQERGRFCD